MLSNLIMLLLLVCCVVSSIKNVLCYVISTMTEIKSENKDNLFARARIPRLETDSQISIWLSVSSFDREGRARVKQYFSCFTLVRSFSGKINTLVRSFSVNTQNSASRNFTSILMALGLGFFDF